jgi:SAM-dependent methyltransferase
MEMYDDENTLKKSFDTGFIPEESLQAQWAELIELKKVISDLFWRKKSTLTILDIGIGNARIVKHLSAIPEIWKMVERYDGTDNVQSCVDISNSTIHELKLQDKVKVYLLEATQLNKWGKTYDLIITTWFTAGNFYPDNFSFETYKNSKERLDLTVNKKFDLIFSNAYRLLNPGGEIVIGACYIDNDNTRKKQEAFYKKMGMHIITTEKDSFTATEERFWSQRFTRERLYNYLHFIRHDNISFIPLDTYDYAMQVRIKK